MQLHAKVSMHAQERLCWAHGVQADAESLQLMKQAYAYAVPRPNVS